MLRQARVAPTVSAYTYLWGQHDYNANPFAPLGCKVKAHIMPEVRKTWAAHTASGYYIRNAWEHYRCHQVYISSSKHECVSGTVFFRHKYLAMPTIGPAEALIKAVDNIVDVILGQLPKNSVTDDAMEQLMEIYKIKAEKATCKARAQRVLREQVQAQRVVVEQQSQVPQPTSPKQNPASIPSFEVEDSTNKPTSVNGHNIISQDEDSPPSSNTCQQCQKCMLTQDYMLHMIEILGYTAAFTPAQASCHKYPLQFLCDFAYAVLDNDTGDLLEYRHLIKLPKHKDIWIQLFGKEIRRLACWGGCRNCSRNYKAWRASGGKYEARVAIFRILATVDRFSWISRKVESH
jgi:hypothetical protein